MKLGFNCKTSKQIVLLLSFKDKLRTITLSLIFLLYVGSQATVSIGGEKLIATLANIFVKDRKK